MSEILSVPFLKFSHRISLLIGLILLMIAKEIFYKVKRSYYITTILLLLGGIATFLKGFDYEEALLIWYMTRSKIEKDHIYSKGVDIKKVTNFLM